MPAAASTNDVFGAITDPCRRAILHEVASAERSVGELSESVSAPQPSVSKHLKVLADLGVVRGRAEGRRRLYSLTPGALDPVRDWISEIEAMWNGRLDRLEAYLQEDEERCTKKGKGRRDA